MEERPSLSKSKGKGAKEGPFLLLTLKSGGTEVEESPRVEIEEDMGSSLLLLTLESGGTEVEEGSSLLLSKSGQRRVEVARGKGETIPPPHVEIEGDVGGGGLSKLDGTLLQVLGTPMVSIYINIK